MSVGVSVNVHILSYVYLVFVEDPCVTIFLMLFRIFSRRSYRAANKMFKCLNVVSQVSRGLQSVSECGGSGGSHCAFPFLCKLLSNAIGLQCIPGDAVCCTELHIGAFEITTLHAQ